jgi:paraquat-inducible protein B
MINNKFETMKKKIIIFVILIFPGIWLSAQNPNLEKLNSYKIGFFTKKLNLTSAEAEKFWPVYNEYQKQKNQIQLDRISLIRNFNQNEGNLSDSQMTEIGDKLVSAITQESALAVSFHKKLKEVLPPEKVIRFYQAENQFKAQLLNELQGRQKQRLQQGPDL